MGLPGSGRVDRRILILGAPGSGKSTLSRRLGAVMGVNPIDLDTVAAVAYRTGQRPRPVEPLLAEAERIASQRRWIAEGIFTTWTAPLVRAATDVVIVRTSLGRCLWRVIRRDMRNDSREHGGLWRLVTFCAEIVDYYRNVCAQAHWANNPDRTTLATTLRMASSAGDRVVILSNNQEIEQFVGVIAGARESPAFQG